jgi:hypothetical protein
LEIGGYQAPRKRLGIDGLKYESVFNSPNQIIFPTISRVDRAPNGPDIAGERVEKLLFLKFFCLGTKTASASLFCTGSSWFMH